MRIDTEIAKVIVEIEDNDYEVAEKTVETAEKLIDAQKRCIGQPEYKLWLAELDVLLGKSATAALFHSGKRENIDRVQRIHAGVVSAFEYNATTVQEERTRLQMEQIAPVNELIRQLNSLNKADEKKTVRRG